MTDTVTLVVPDDAETEEIRASEIEEADVIFNSAADEWQLVDVVGTHGDTILVTGTDGEEWTYDRDEVVERLTDLTTPALRLAVLARQYDSGSNDVPPADDVSESSPWLLIEQNTRDSSEHFYSLHGSIADAASYTEGQEYAGDWDPRLLLNLITGEEHEWPALTQLALKEAAATSPAAAFVWEVARLSLNGEDGFEMTATDALETLTTLITRARSLPQEDA